MSDDRKINRHAGGSLDLFQLLILMPYLSFEFDKHIQSDRRIPALLSILVPSIPWCICSRHTRRILHGHDLRSGRVEMRAKSEEALHYVDTRPQISKEKGKENGGILSVSVKSTVSPVQITRFPHMQSHIPYPKRRANRRMQALIDAQTL